MTTNIYFGLAAAALAITLQASSAMADPGGWGGGTGYGRCYGERNSVTGQRLRIPCPENGFGSRTPVTLPPDRHPPAGKSTGIPVTKTPSSVLTNAQPKYFRPR
jgi:hypothetical protein